MSQSSITYRFDSITSCNMCGAPEHAFTVLGRRLNRSQGIRPRLRTGITTSVCRCGRCGLVFANPQPVPPSVGAHYDVPPHQYLNRLTAGDGYFSKELAWLEGLAPFTPGMRSLDVGAGIGIAMAAMARRGFDAYGLEPSTTFYQHAIDRNGLPAERLLLASVETADYPERYFDFINFGAVLEHLPSPAASLERALRWLKRDGIIFAEVPYARWLIGRLANAFYRISGTDFVANLSPMHPPFHLYEFTLESFQMHGVAAGYVVADHRHLVCETYLPPVLRAMASYYMRLTRTGMQLCVCLRKTG